jgi:hypothetical protein
VQPNRDERRYIRPDDFDTTRDARNHLAWGTGRAHLRRDASGAHRDGSAPGSVGRGEMSLGAGSFELGTNAGLYWHVADLLDSSGKKS